MCGIIGIVGKAPVQARLIDISPVRSVATVVSVSTNDYKRLIDILEPTPKTVDELQRIDTIPAGVDVEIRL